MTCMDACEGVCEYEYEYLCVYFSSKLCVGRILVKDSSPYIRSLMSMTAMHRWSIPRRSWRDCCAFTMKDSVSFYHLKLGSAPTASIS